MRTVWAMGIIHMKPRVLRLFEWTRDFNMNQQKNTHAQVLIRLMALPHGYWMERTLWEIASTITMLFLVIFWRSSFGDF